ncbi:uncharacterized protein LOC122093057 [Macadamia integrifolia]|uniref:uncharacterized protein LOC122093057 n=1 Tax=Macadamia integrifolia TaxID=60698 RepID=UPI001C52FA49|nr:uncharacterized protein LOC122093057 [Macadamia integrifolia]
MTLRNGRVLGTPEQNFLAEDSEKEMSLDPSSEAPPASKDDELEQVGRGNAIKQVPTYAKFLKDLYTQKRKLKIHILKTVQLTEQVTVVLSNKLPLKLKDPRTPLISYNIENLPIERALFDLGASVNILLILVCNHLGFGELKPTEVILQFVDRSIKVPRGCIEDVLVKVDELYFPVDFLVLDMEAPTNGKPQSIFLGRPFLSTSNVCINYRSGAMHIFFGNRKLRLNIFNAFLGPQREDECFSIDVIEQVVAQYTLVILADDPMQQCLTFFGGDDFDVDSYATEVNALLDAPTFSDRPPWTIKFESIPPLAEKLVFSSIEPPPMLELKPLPDSLKYPFLGSNETLRINIASNLTPNQESKLLDVLNEHKVANG